MENEVVPYVGNSVEEEEAYVTENVVIESSSASVNPSVSGSEIQCSTSIVLENTKEPNYTIFVSPNNTKYWIPICEDELKPTVGKLFKTLNEAIQAYSDYAFRVGFDTRQGTSVQARGVTKLKYIYCNRSGFRNKKNVKNLRKKLSARVGCNARVIYKYFENQGYVVMKFIEEHTHSLVRELEKLHMKRNRKMYDHHQNFVLDCGKQRIGPAKSYRLFKEMVGGYQNVGPTAVDFKNHMRDLLAYFNGSDAQVMIDRFYHKKEICSAFYFAFDVDRDDQLARLFWCDAVSRKNYAQFGNVVSFDSTYNMNRYKMVFCPFTGYDHHKSLVLFAAGLLQNENSESYEWVFKHFKEAMGRAPTVMTTDQDLGMKTAMEKVFPETRHRFCMWHITEKLSGKVDTTNKNCYDFARKMGRIVWDMEMLPEDFEREWKSVMEEFNLEHHSWLSDLYAKRAMWIPAYFRDVKLSGLVRTTSISESMNSFFRKFSNYAANLIEFMLYYESGIETQRHNQSKRNYDCDVLTPTRISPLKLEENASKLYTLSTWKLFQEQLEKALYGCRVLM